MEIVAGYPRAQGEQLRGNGRGFIESGEHGAEDDRSRQGGWLSRKVDYQPHRLSFPDRYQHSYARLHPLLQRGGHQVMQGLVEGVEENHFGIAAADRFA